MHGISMHEMNERLHAESYLKTPSTSLRALRILTKYSCVLCFACNSAAAEALIFYVIIANAVLFTLAALLIQPTLRPQQDKVDKRL
jgi:hypothetical protein